MGFNQVNRIPEHPWWPINRRWAR